MSSQIDRIVEVAERYIGIKENPPNSNNVIFNTRYYGKPVSGSAYPWCCAFIWCLFQDIGAPELFYGGNKTASCTELMRYAVSHRLDCYSGFKPGDLVLFDFDGDKRKSEHVGIVERVGAKYDPETGRYTSNPLTVVTIEGNTAVGNDSNGGEVMRRTRPLSQIIAAYRPAYAEDKTETEDEEEMVKRYNTVAELPAWAKATIEKLLNKKYLLGDGGKLDLTEDMIRILVINDRAGIYG